MFKCSYLIALPLLLAFVFVFVQVSTFKGTDEQKGKDIVKKDGNDNCGRPHQDVLVVAGVQKGGTSAIYSVIKAHHPSFEVSWNNRPRTRETHFFDKTLHERDWGIPTGNQETILKGSSRHKEIPEPVVCNLRQAYYDHWKLTTKTMLMEKTPNYMYQPYVPSLLKKVVPHAKILLILREPVSRAFSQFKMFSVREEYGFNSFTELINGELDYWRKQNMTNVPPFDYNSTTIEEDSAFDLAAGLSVKDRYKPLPYSGAIQKGIYSEQLVPWLQHFELGKTLLVLNYDKWNEDPIQAMQHIEEFAGVPHQNISLEAMTHNYHQSKGQGLSILNEEKAYLQQFYKPYNAELEQLLGEEWKGVWNYE